MAARGCHGVVGTSVNVPWHGQEVGRKTLGSEGSACEMMPSGRRRARSSSSSSATSPVVAVVAPTPAPAPSSAEIENKASATAASLEKDNAATRISIQARQRDLLAWQEADLHEQIQQ